MSAGSPDGARSSTSYSSRMSPMSSSTRSSRVTMPSVPPYSSTTTARCMPSWRMIETAGSTSLVPGSISTGRQTSRTSRSGSAAGAEQVAHVQDAEHVVEALAGDRVARVGQVADLRRGLGQGEVAGDEGDVGARTHHLLDARLGGGEDVAEDAALVRLELLVGRHQLAQLLLGELLAGGVGVAAEQPDEGVGREREQPDDRAHQGREPVQHGRHRQRDLRRLLEREPLGHELPEDEREVGDDQGEDDQCRRPGGVLTESEVLEVRREVGRERRPAVRRGEEAGDGDADLDRGEEAVGVARDLGHPGAARTLALHGGQLALAQRDQRDLGGGEDAADQDEQQDQDDVVRGSGCPSGPFTPGRGRE